LTVLDFGAHSNDPADDYPDFCESRRAMAVGGRPGPSWACLVCTSGVGICITGEQGGGRARGRGRGPGDGDVDAPAPMTANVLLPERKENAV